MPSDASKAAGAKVKIESKGRVVDIFSVNRTPDDSAKAWRGSSSQPHESKGGVSFRAKVLFLPASGSGFGKMLRQEGGGLSVAFDQVGLLASDSIPSRLDPKDLEKCNKVRDGDDIWSIVTLGHLKPADTSILFVMGLKR